MLLLVEKSPHYWVGQTSSRGPCERKIVLSESSFPSTWTESGVAAQLLSIGWTDITPDGNNTNLVLGLVLALVYYG